MSLSQASYQAPLSADVLLLPLRIGKTACLQQQPAWIAHPSFACVSSALFNSSNGSAPVRSLPLEKMIVGVPLMLRPWAKARLLVTAAALQAFARGGFMPLSIHEYQAELRSGAHQIASDIGFESAVRIGMRRV